jgi:hypothetical protein
MKLRIVVADDNPGFLDVMVSILRMEFDVVCDGRRWQIGPGVC